MSEHETITKARLALANAQERLKRADAEHNEASRLWREMSGRVLQPRPRPANRGPTILPPKGEKEEARERAHMAAHAFSVAKFDEQAASAALDDALRAHHPDLVNAREAFKSARKEGCPFGFTLHVNYENNTAFCEMCKEFYSIDEPCVSCGEAYGCPVCCLNFVDSGDLRPGQNKCTNCVYPILGSKWPIVGREANPVAMFMLALKFIALQGGGNVGDEYFKFEEERPEFAALSRTPQLWELRKIDSPEKKQRKE